MDRNVIYRGSPHEFSGLAFGVACFHDSAVEIRRELLTIEFNYDTFSLAAFRELLPHVLSRRDLDRLQHAWISWSFPDGLGSVISWALPDGTGGTLIEYGLGPERTFQELVEHEPERLADLADVIVADIDNGTCFRHFGRVFSIRERYLEIVAEYLLRSEGDPRIEQVAPGYFISVRRKSTSPPDFGCICHDPNFAVFPLQEGTATLERIGQPPTQRSRFVPGERELALETILSPRALMSEWRRVAARAGLRLHRLSTGASPRVRLTNELGLSMAFDGGEVLERAAARVRSLGEQALLQDLMGARILTAQVAFMKELDGTLPEQFKKETIGRDGLLRVRHPRDGMRILNLWTLPLEFDLEEADSRARFLRFLETAAPGPLDGPLQRVVTKELHSRHWLRATLSQTAGTGCPRPLYRLRADLVEVYSHGLDEQASASNDVVVCEGDVAAAELCWQKYLPESRWHARGLVVRAGHIIQHRILVLAGPGISGTVLDPRLLRGLCDAAGFHVGRRVHAFAPRSGLLVLAEGWVPHFPLRHVAYRFFIDYARDHLSHLLGDTLHFRSRIKLPPPGRGIGSFSLKPLEVSWILPG